MMVLLNNQSALECWERGAGNYAAPIARGGEIAFTGSVRNLRKHDTTLQSLSQPVCIIVSQRNSRNRSPRFCCSVWDKPFPSNSIFTVESTDLALSAPWFCFLQMASKLSFAEAMLLGMELCGTYSTLPFSRSTTKPFTLAEEDARRGFIARKALMPAKELRRFLNALYPNGSKSMAFRVAAFIVDGSHSPAESRLFALLYLPVRHGGFGLPIPQLNVSMPLPHESRRLTGKTHFTCDQFFREFGVAIEYDGAYHGSDNQRLDDNLRELMLDSLGIRLLRVDRRQLEDLDLLTFCAQRIASELGVKLRNPSPQSLEKRRALHKAMMNWSVDVYRR